MLRRLTADDADAFRALRRAGVAAAPDNFRFDPADDFSASTGATRERLARGVAVGAFADGALVAIGAVEPFAGAKLAHKWLLWGMYVARPGQGLGERIVTALVTAARDAGAQSVQLTVMADNDRAIALYARCGFRQYAVEPQSVARSDGLADEALMRIVL